MSTRWVIAQLNGRTDVDPRRNQAEVGFTCAVGVLMAVVVRAVFTSVITKTMIDISELTSDKKKRVRMVNEYLESHQVSPWVASAMKTYLRDYKDIDRDQKKESQILGILPAHVQLDLLLEVRSPAFQHHAFLHKIAQDFPRATRNLCKSALRPLSAMQYEVMFDKGEACSRMCFVVEGTMLYGSPVAKQDEQLDFTLASTTQSGAKIGRFNSALHANAAESLHLLRHSLADNDKSEFLGIQVTNILREGGWISEPALWVEWINQGRLVADCRCSLFELQAQELARAFASHSEAYARAVLYSRKFFETLRKQETLSDIASFEIVTRRIRLDLRLKVTIISAANLTKMDTFSMSDAYAICRVGGLQTHSELTRTRTGIVNNSLDPVWDHEAEMCSETSAHLEIQVWDHETPPFKDRMIGTAIIQCSVFREDPAVWEREVPLVFGHGETAVQSGIVRLRVETLLPLQQE